VHCLQRYICVLLDAICWYTKYKKIQKMYHFLYGNLCPCQVGACKIVELVRTFLTLKSSTFCFPYNIGATSGAVPAFSPANSPEKSLAFSSAVH
jgi:hypothetical protein